MAQMPTTAIAMDFRPYGKKGAIRACANGAIHRVVETGPPGAAVELGFRGKEGVSASGTDIDAFPVFFIEGTRARSFRSMLS